MKNVKHILLLVFGILGVCYLAIAVVSGMAIQADPSADPDAMIVSLVFGILGAVFLLVTIILALTLNRGSKKRRELLDYGIRVTATVTDVRPNYSIKVNRRCPWQVYAECTHPLTGEHVVLHSHNLWYCNISTGQSVEIAFDQMNEKKFAFDLHEPEGGV